MALKLSLTPAEFAALSPELQKEYGADGTAANNYRLLIHGEADPGAMKRAVEHANNERKAALDAAKELQDKLDEAARKAGDIKTLEASWQKKIDDATKATEEAKKTATENLRKALVAVNSKALAKDLAINADVAALLVSPIEKYMSVGEKDGVPVLVILDDDGKPTEQTLDDLAKKFRDNKMYSAIVTGSKASGSGAHGSHGGNSVKPFGEMTANERAALHTADPAQFERLSKEHAAANPL